jgi:hypothetical protein
LPNSELDEKLLLASVNASSFEQNDTTVTRIQKHYASTTSDPLEGPSHQRNNKQYAENGIALATVTQPLLSDILDDDTIPRMRILKMPKNDFSFNGSDCDISWICLLICILALCFIIPLIYVLYIAEHPEKFQHNGTGTHFQTL